MIRGGGLARARLADDAEGTTGREVEADPGHGGSGGDRVAGERLVQVADTQGEWLFGSRHRRRRELCTADEQGALGRAGRDRVDETPGVLVLGSGEHLACVAVLDDLAVAHHGHAVGEA